ncbi:hypothetical protein GPECTOR_68g395 [Gonium pectorale]|uniref:Uncharacterized protein n=1 Tax=Gonium pectorale TaxID=33097 RepID=A0A150G3G5_GONPE|nr:hypothetical protein GPECTOR_68g395 [Gonium pectorale]|eukprot:KXZ44422.1 hypothetical protein GPECTOR_68g395 [Gonium pectorale]
MRRSTVVSAAAAAALVADTSASAGSAFSGGSGSKVKKSWFPGNLRERLIIHPQSSRLLHWFQFIVGVSLLIGWLGPYDMAFGGHGVLTWVAGRAGGRAGDEAA